MVRELILKTKEGDDLERDKKQDNDDKDNQDLDEIKIKRKQKQVMNQFLKNG